jgi:prevent-host-death family protein
MASVGVGELRQNASALLRRVEAGEIIEVTDRGRPVAVLAPVPDLGPLSRLRASGDVIPSKAPLRTLPPPIELAEGEEPPSAVLARLRRDER